MKVGLVLLAGGSGLRMGSEIPKQFIPINNKPILQHTIDRFKSWNKDLEIVLVLPENQIDYWHSLTGNNSNLPYSICSGGKERFNSVKKGIDTLKDCDYVMIHDGVRPFVSDATLNRCIDALQEYDAVIPVVKANESIRMIDGDKSIHLNRDNIRLVQTPQCFSYKMISEAYKVEYKNSFTDDASVFENQGGEVHLVEGNGENIKITKAEDLAWAKAFLQ